MRWLSCAFVPALILSLAACDSGPEPDAKQDDAAAKAKAEEDAKKAEEEEALRKGLEKKQAAEAAEKAKYDAIADVVVKAPDKLPKDLDTACTELIYIYSDWVKAIYFDDDKYQITFFDSKKENLGKVKGSCAKLDSVEAAACMTEVIKAVTAEGAYTEEQFKLLQAKPDYLFDACVDKYAPGK